VTGLLLHAPTEPELERLYYELALLGATSVGFKRTWPYCPQTQEQLIALAGECIRYDPRLLSIVLQLFLRIWTTIHPVRLRQEMAKMRSPQALLVALEFAKDASSESEFRYWIEYLSAGWPRLNTGESFFFDLERPASRRAKRRIGRNLAAYVRWGFTGSERPVVDNTTKRSVGRYDAVTRKRLVMQLAQRKKRFSLADYLDDIDHSISRQQALADLKSCFDLTVVGHGRGARWQLRAELPTPAASARFGK
jgi:hypothetical protein